MDPVHEHDWIIREVDDKNVRCSGCREKIHDQNSNWCTLCESYYHERCAKLPLEIKVFFHPCPLIFHSLDYFRCNSCFGKFHRGFSYRCGRCDFSMCLKCTDQALSLATCGGESVTEQIRHCCHRHPLQPLPLRLNCLSSCPVCKMSCSFGPTWGCEPCGFRVHKPCLDFLPEIVQINLGSLGDTWILQISKEVPRGLAVKQCIDCSQTPIPNLVFRSAEKEVLCIYCCLVRIVFKKSSSSQVPKVINHFFHPCPNLELKLYLTSSPTCNACFLNQPNFSYHCKSCDFFLCFNCSQLPQLDSHENEANQLILHFCHPHPLKLFTGTVTTNHICNLCENFCSEPFYNCNDQCQFCIHKSCMDSLPFKKGHLSLNQTLVLMTVPTFECTTCKRQSSGFTFYCSKKKYKFCVGCVLWPKNGLGKDGKFKSLLHWHQLSVCETRVEHKRRRCFLCKELCLAWTWSYKCNECDLFFHKSCAELPAELEHPMHPHHLLTLTLLIEAMTCNLCLKSLSRDFPFYDLVYRCHLCGFQLDIQCATYLPSLEYKGHPHLLYAVVNMNGNTNCYKCYQSCEGSCFRCGDQGCDFTLHFQCGPLPRTVKHACHVDPLILKDYFVEDNGSDLFACHICEEERQPRDRVYCCSQGCLMICEVKCVLYEVLRLLRGECGEVELITPFPQVACRVIHIKSDYIEMMSDTAIAKHVFSFHELFDSIETGTNLFFGQLLKLWGNCFHNSGSGGVCGFEPPTSCLRTDQTGTNLDEEESIETGTNLDEQVGSYSFTWEALSRFKESLRTPSEDEFALNFFYLGEYEGSIMAGAHALPEILCPIYEEFFERYNIIDHKCNLNYSQRRYLIFLTCFAIHEMRIKKVVDVTKETILRWLGIIRLVEKEGKFNVGIVAENIKELWEAHYYIQAKKIVDDETSRIDRELEKVSMYQAEQRTKMDELWYKVNEAEATRQKWLLRDKEHTAYSVHGSRGPMKKVRSKALEIKWRSCYDSLVLYPGNLQTK